MSAMRFVLLFLAAATLQGCAQQENFDNAEQSVTLFHDRLNRGVYDEIWELTAPNFRDGQVRDNARAIFSAMHSRLGMVLESQSINTGSYVAIGQGETITLVYHTTFERGSGTEVFTFTVESGALKLWSYNINSDDFTGEDVSDYQRMAESGA